MTRTYVELAQTVDAQGRRQAWIAKQMGVSETTVSLWLSGKRALTTDRAQQLAALLGLDESEVA